MKLVNKYVSKNSLSSYNIVPDFELPEILSSTKIISILNDFLIANDSLGLHIYFTLHFFLQVLKTFSIFTSLVVHLWWDGLY